MNFQENSKKIVKKIQEKYLDISWNFQIINVPPLDVTTTLLTEGVLADA